MKEDDVRLLAQALGRLHTSDAVELLDALTRLVTRLEKTAYGSVGLRIGRQRARISSINVDESESIQLRSKALSVTGDRPDS